MKNFYKDKDILVTGGAGSIGRAIVKTLVQYKPKRIRVLDQNESAQFYLQQELNNNERVRHLIGDIRNLNRVIWAAKGTDIIIHCAALKHVPACEYNVSEAIETNIIGLNNVIKAANRWEVEKCIYISTDKAVYPENVMGITKLMGEKMVNNAVVGSSKTKFATIRFGNVLNSNGSVIPLFKKQINSGGPVTITHPEMTRFFMTIKQAVRLILKAIGETKGKETYILKMNSLKITDLADAMIEELATKKTDIKIIGIRPGEKLKELLLTEEERKYAKNKDNMFILSHQLLMPHLESRIKEIKGGIPIQECDSSKSNHMTKQEIKDFLKSERII